MSEIYKNDIYFKIIPFRMRKGASKYGKILILNLDGMHMSIHFTISIFCHLILFHNKKWEKGR